MGSTDSKDEEIVGRLLKNIVSLREPNYDKKALEGLIVWARAKNLLPSAQAAFEVSIWGAIKAQIWEEMERGSKNVRRYRKYPKVWLLIVESLQDLSTEQRKLIIAQGTLSGVSETAACLRADRSVSGEVLVPAETVRKVGAAESDAGTLPAPPPFSAPAVGMESSTASEHASSGTELLEASEPLDVAASPLPGLIMSPEVTSSAVVSSEPGSETMETVVAAAGVVPSSVAVATEATSARSAALAEAATILVRATVSAEATTVPTGTGAISEPSIAPQSPSVLLPKEDEKLNRDNAQELFSSFPSSGLSPDDKSLDNGSERAIMPAIKDLKDTLLLCFQKLESKLEERQLVQLNTTPSNVSTSVESEPWKALDWKILKEVKMTVMQHGLKSNYTQIVLWYLFTAHLLTPYDIRKIISMLLSPFQQLEFFTEWSVRCAAVVAQPRQKGHPLFGVSADMLMGFGQYDSAYLQNQFPDEVLKTSQALAYKSLLLIRDAKSRLPCISIKQGPTEPYDQFVDRLNESINSDPDMDSDMKAKFLDMLAYNNANENTKRVLSTLPRSATTTQFLEAAAKNDPTRENNLFS